MTQQKEKRMTVTIEGQGFGGEGYVQPSPGRFVSVPHTLEGDVVEIEVGDFHRGRAWAVALSWESKNPAHVDPRCEDYGRCSGCALRHISLRDEMTWKKAQIIEILERYGPASCSGLEVELVCAGSRQGHRSRGRFRVKVDESGRVKVGLRGLNLEGEPVDIRGCPAQASLFRDTLARVADVLDQDPEAARQVVDIEIWTGEGEALVLVEVDREEALVTMRAPLATAALPKATTALGLRHEGETVMVHGEPVVPVHHRWGRQKVRVSAPPTSWTHANPAAAARLIDWVDRQVQGGRHRVALDLCCATGTLTLHLAHNFEKIFAVDEDHLAIAALREACVTAGIEGVEFRAGRASKVVRKLCRERARPTLAIINPMRRPLGRKELREIALLGVEEVLYLGPSAVSTAKDSVVLEELGFKPTKAAIINLHPGTSQTMLGMVWSR